MVETTDGNESGRKVGLLDYWRAVWKRRWSIVALCVLSLLIALPYSLTLPKIYVAKATVLVQKDTSSLGGNLMNSTPPSLSGGAGRSEGGGMGLEFFGAAQLLGLNLFGPSTSQNLSIALLKSRTMREEVVQHFQETLGPGATIGKMEVGISREDVLTLSVESTDPAIASAAANFYLENMQKMITRRSKAQREAEDRYYLERIDQARQEFREAQNNLVQFQEKNRTLVLTPGTRSQIDTAAMNAGSMMAIEVQRELKRMYLTEQHPEMIALNRQIYEMKRQLSHSLYGDPQDLPPESPKAPPRKEFFVAAAKMTPLYFKMAEVYRDFKLKEAVYNFLVQNIETARYIKDPPQKPLDWLDPAIPPKGYVRPNIPYNVLAAGIGSLVLGIFLGLFLEYLERVKSQERLQITEPRLGRRLVPAPELANGLFAPELANGPVPVGDSLEEPVAYFPERRRSAVEPVAREMEGRRFL